MYKNFFLFTLSLFTFHFSFAQNNITWNVGMNINASATGNEHPRMVTDAAGNPLVLWGNTGSAMFSRWDGIAFTTPVELTTTVAIAEANWMGPDIGANGNNVYVVFKQIPEADTSSHIYIIHSSDGGINFSAPVKVDNIGDSISRFPTVTVDASGNPIVGYMKFNSSFGDTRWVVAKSTNLGNSFSPDVKASGYSSMTAEVCDCCPGSITCNGNTIAMMYRDNNANIRDTWAGISSDGGNTFPSGVALDMQNWMLMSCPSSGPDGVIIGDSLYSTYMNGAGGTNLVYFNKSSLSNMANTAGATVTGIITGLTQQNYPHIANSGNAVAVIWKQIVNGNTQLLMRFTDDITQGLPTLIDTIDSDNITNADVTLLCGKIFVVWEDDASGTVKFRSGSYGVPNTISAVSEKNDFKIFQNPVSETLHLSNVNENIFSISILNELGQTVKSINHNFSNIDVSNMADGIYFLQTHVTHQDPVFQKFIVKHEK